MPITHAIRKYGKEAFDFSVLYVAFTREDAWAWECREIASARASGVRLYNVTAGGEGAAGWKRAHSEETKRKISASLTGRKQTQETVEKRANVLRGRKRSPELVNALADFNRGRKSTPEHREKLRMSHQGPRPWRTGISPSETTKDKIKSGLLLYWGKKRQKREERRAEIEGIST